MTRTTIDHPRLCALAQRVLVADSAMGTMLQAQDASLDDFAGLEGCHEILTVTRPDIVRAVHRGYLEVGVDAVEPSRIGVELSEEYQLHPDQSTSALVVHHPEAKYFAAR